LNDVCLPTTKQQTTNNKQPQQEFEKKRRCQTDIARVLRGYFARKKFKKLLLRLPRFAAPLLQRCIRIFQVLIFPHMFRCFFFFCVLKRFVILPPSQRRLLLRRIAKIAKDTGKNWRGIEWIKPASHLKETSDYLREVYRRHMARNYRNSLTPARRFTLQEKLEASELFKGKKQSYPDS